MREKGRKEEREGGRREGRQGREAEHDGSCL
jgi:hypothetical protein